MRSSKFFKLPILKNKWNTSYQSTFRDLTRRQQMNPTEYMNDHHFKHLHTIASLQFLMARLMIFDFTV